MIVGLSTIEDIGSGFRERFFAPRWRRAQDLLGEISYDRFAALRIRIIIGNVERHHIVKGFESERKLVVEAGIPIDEFKKLSTGEKGDLVLDTIFESIRSAYGYFDDVPPAELDRIWQESRAVAIVDTR